MSIKDITKLILSHTLVFIVGTVLFILLFQTTLFSNIEVLFYRGILFLLITCLVIALGLFALKKHFAYRLFTYRDIILAIVLIFSFNIIFFTHVPVTADRSLSIFILGQMNKNSNKTFTEEEIAGLFSQQFVRNATGIDKRFKEQIISGNIVRIDDGFQISSQGKLLIKFYSLIADIFKISKVNIFPQ